MASMKTVKRFRLMALLMTAVACCAVGVGCSSGTGNAATDAGQMDAVAGTTVEGTLTLPGAAAGKPYTVSLFTVAGMRTVTPTAETSGSAAGSTVLTYSIVAVPAGTYFLLAFVDNDNSGGTASTPGDYAGWYGHDGSGNPPATPNVIVPSGGSVTFDFSLVLR